jgi:hypothetical protein
VFVNCECGERNRLNKLCPDEFPIIIVTQEAYELSKTEAMGSKYKFWFEYPELGRCLYKQARLDLGEDWAEKVASELCELLGIPHANYSTSGCYEVQ